MYKNKPRNLRFSERQWHCVKGPVIKNEKSFFGSIQSDRKNTLFEKMNDFSFKHKLMKQKIKQRIMKDLGGIGTKNSVPPESFQPNDLTFFWFSQVKSEWELYLWKVWQYISMFQGLTKTHESKSWVKQKTSFWIWMF